MSLCLRGVRVRELARLLFGLVHLPIGSDTYSRSLRRRHVERICKAAGMSNRRAERFAHRIP